MELTRSDTGTTSRTKQTAIPGHHGFLLRCRLLVLRLREILLSVEPAQRRKSAIYYDFGGLCWLPGACDPKFRLYYQYFCCRAESRSGRVAS
jgi:hypothetical protein